MNVNDIKALLQGADDDWLFRKADEIRRQVFGLDVYLRGVVEFSNCCINRCLYCGLRRHNCRLERYRMEPDDIVRATASAPELGIGTVVLQSGDDFHYTKDEIGSIIKQIKCENNVAVTLSIGDRIENELGFWRDCDADRYLLKIETFNAELYQKLRPGSRVNDRLQRIELLKKLGYEVGSGIITDLPGMTVDILVEDIARLARLNLDMIAAGPFVPHPDTPLAKERPGGILNALRTIALIRLTNPNANIPATSALSSLDQDARKRALLCGANVLMPSITPEDVRGHYTIYPGKNVTVLQTVDHIAQCKRMIKAAGFVPSGSQGFSPRRNHGQSATGRSARNSHPWTQECR